MNCQDSQERIQELLDGVVLPPSDDFTGHVRHCPECRDMHLAALVLHGALATLEPPAPPPHFAPRVVALALAERRARRTWRHRFGARVALAASVVLLLLGYLAAPRTTQPTPPRTEVAAVTKPAKPPPTLRRMASDTGESVAVELRKTADEKVKHTGQVLSALAVPLKTDPAVTTPMPTDSLRGTRDGMSSGLEPVSTHAQRAFKLFLREVPPLEPEPRTGS